MTVFAGIEALIRNGRFEDAITLTERARTRDPLSFNAYTSVGSAYRAARQYERAVAEIRRALDLNPCQTRANFQLDVTFMGRLNDGINELEARARQQYVSSFGMALIHDVLGEKEAALAAFERAHQDRAVEFAQMTQYPPFKTIASEPRFQALMREIGLPR